ncbi:Pimeloyl-ACP methyl ester carboxylesterase [Robiginitalea myxolifaciens]|uniref:Pimeloyl-ACP methyl ester carboxylesterase n=2 Tax=Robiginitalea myxolifaciens TaxID=400055 RepID=A0A1I6HLN9_9FLAO|nr:Pimeloyl-ACP methyl ester carboxylesterase [Robiginitalea myxolifaciens]
MKVILKIFKWLGILLGVLLLVFVILLLIPEKETVKAIEPRENTSYWEMNEGFSIAFTHLKSDSETDNSPVIFLHGGPGGYVHTSIIETLSELTHLGHDIYLYDQRGSGLSDRLPKFSDVSFEKHVNDLKEIISERIKTNKVILIGQSFGSAIVSHFSAKHPELVEKIIFSSPGKLLPKRINGNVYLDLDSLYPKPDSLEFIAPYRFVEDVDRTAFKPKAIVATTGALLFDKRLISDKQMDRILNTLATKFTKGMVCDQKNVLPEEGGGGLYAFLATNNGVVPKVRDDLKKVDSPVLVIQGQCDYIPFSAAYEYVHVYPNAKYQFIENAGHEIWWEQKEDYLNRIKEFLLE